VPEQERALYEQKTSMVLDPSRRREIKIRQYQKEKDLRARIEVRIIVIIFLLIHNHIPDCQETQGSTFFALRKRFIGVRPYLFSASLTFKIEILCYTR
jgi:hypothetical protein